MIGHYLLTLTAEQEERVLTGRMGPITAAAGGLNHDNRCLVMTAHNLAGFGKCYKIANYIYNRENGPCLSVGDRYDAACNRFGEVRVNTAIRNRILANQVRRELRGVRPAEVAAA